jgi:hypothetical protein
MLKATIDEHVHKGQLSTNLSGTCRSADGPVAVIALASRKGDAVRRLMPLDQESPGWPQLDCLRLEPRRGNSLGQWAGAGGVGSPSVYPSAMQSDMLLRGAYSRGHVANPTTNPSAPTVVP